MSDSHQPLTTNVRQQGSTMIIDLQGEINSFADAELNNAYAEAEAKNPERIVLNLTEVTYINSSGIAVIVGLLAQARKSKLEIAVFGLTEHYRHIFEITKLSDFMSILPDEQSALKGESEVADSTLEK